MTNKPINPPDIVIGNWIRDTIPDCTGWSCFVLNGAFYGSVVRMMALAGFSKAENVDDADVVVFTGGSDINPALYGEEPIKETHGINEDRDLFEEAIYKQCIRRGIPMFGICRGAQFLWAMNDGSLWQHVDNHTTSHYIVDLEEEVRVMATSIHHQSCCWDPMLGAVLLAVPEDDVATVFKSQDLEINLSSEKKERQVEVEAAYFPDTKCFLVQGHPEVGSPEYASWAMTKLAELMLEWEEIDLADGDEEEQTNPKAIAKQVLDQIG